MGYSRVEPGSAHLQRCLYQKSLETFASLFRLLMDIRLVTLKQGKLLIRVA